MKNKPRNGSTAQWAIASLLLGTLSFSASPAVAVSPTPDNGICELVGFESNSSAASAGSAADPYKISSETELKEVLDCDGTSEKHFVLSADITGASAWTPLGSTTSPFIGNFDGRGHSITVEIDTFLVGDYGNNQHGRGTGLFVAVQNSEFSNLTIEVDFNVASGPGGRVENIGSLAGHANGTTFRNISASFSASVTSGASGLTRVGGIVGRVAAMSGFTAAGASQVRFLNSHVSFTLYDQNTSGMGGLFGAATMATGQQVVISQSSAVIHAESGRLNGPQSGGLFGQILGSVLVEDSFAKATFPLFFTNDGRFGGIAGQVFNGSATITNSFVAVVFQNLTTQNSVSPTIGNLAGGSAQLAGVFWDSSLTQQTSQYGGIGLPTEDMKALSTFRDAGWDVQEGYSASSIWGIHPAVNDGYPFLTGSFSSDPTPTAPSYTGATSFNVAEGTAEIGTLTTTPSSQWTVSNDASGLFSIDSQTGELTVSPSAAAGSYAIIIRFTGSNSGFGTQVLSITIAAPQVEQGAQVIAPMPAVPEITEFSSREIRSTGDSVALTGRRLAGVSTLTLGGITVTIVSNTATSLTFTTGEMPVGVWDLRLVGSNGTLVFQQAIEVVEATAIVAESTGELLGYTWTLKFLGNSRSLSDAQQSHVGGELALHPDTTTVICWGYTTAENPNAWAIAHATQRAQAACDLASANNSEVKTVVRLRYGVSKNWAMRSALQFWR